MTPEGIIYEREAILNYMVEQKAKIAATKKRKLKEEQEKDEEVPTKVFKVGFFNENFSEFFLGSIIGRCVDESIWVKGEQLLGSQRNCWYRKGH